MPKKVETDRKELRKESEDEAIRRQQEDLTSEVPKKSSKKATVKPSLFDLSKTDPKAIQAAEAMGLPIRKLAAWADSVQVTQEAHGKAIALIAQNMPNQEQIEGAVVTAIEGIRQRQIQAYQEQMAKGGGSPEGQGRDGGIVGQIIKEALGGGGGGGQDPELRKLQIEMYRANIDSIKHRADLSDKVVEAVIAKIVAEGVKKVV